MKCAIGCADSKFEERVSDNDNFNGSIEIYERKNELEKGGEAEDLAEMENLIGIGLENVIGKKIKKIYKQGQISNNVDFNTCHSAWQTSSIDLAPVSMENKYVYYAIAVPAMVINVVYVLWNLIQILREDIHSTTCRDSPGMKDWNNSIDMVFGTTLSARVHHQKQAIWESKSKLSSAWKVFLLVSPMMSCLLDSVLDGVYFITLKTTPRMIHVPAWVHILQGLLLYTGK